MMSSHEHDNDSVLDLACLQARTCIESGERDEASLAHVASCTDCAAFEADFAFVSDAFTRTRVPEPGDGALNALTDQIMAATRATGDTRTEAEPDWRRRLREVWNWLVTPSPSRNLGLAAAAAVLLAGLGLALWAPWMPPAEPDAVPSRPGVELVAEGVGEEPAPSQVDELDRATLAQLDLALEDEDWDDTSWAEEADGAGLLDASDDIYDLDEDELLAFEAALDGLVDELPK